MYTKQQQRVKNNGKTNTKQHFSRGLGNKLLRKDSVHFLPTFSAAGKQENVYASTSIRSGSTFSIPTWECFIWRCDFCFDNNLRRACSILRFKAAAASEREEKSKAKPTRKFFQAQSTQNTPNYFLFGLGLWWNQHKQGRKGKKGKRIGFEKRMNGCKPHIEHWMKCRCMIIQSDVWWRFPSSKNFSGLCGWLERFMFSSGTSLTTLLSISERESLEAF